MHVYTPSRRSWKVATGVAVAAIAALASVSPVAAADPEPAVPVQKNFFELTFSAAGGSSASGIGLLAANTSGDSGPSLSVEISGLPANTTYRARLAGPVDADSAPTTCAPNLARFGANDFSFEGDNTIETGNEGVLRWTYDPMAAFAGNELLELNNGEPAVVIVNAANTIVACAPLNGTANLISNPTSRNFPVALVGGQSPVYLNNSGIKVSGNVNLTATLLTYDFTFFGENLINTTSGGLENHIMMLRTTDNCGDGSLTTVLKNVEQMITNYSNPTTPVTADNLEAAWGRSPLSRTSVLRVQGSTIISTSDHNVVKDWGIALLGLESASTAQPGGPNTLQTRQKTPSACVALVDKASEVGPGTIADAATLNELINAVDYNTAKDPELLRLYNAFFGRVPDVKGVKYWIAVSRGEIDGKTYGTLPIAGFFAQGTEFKNTYADAPNNSVFLERVYFNILGRQGEPAGVVYWTDILNGTNNSGKNPQRTVGSRAEVVYYVAINAEFVNRAPYLPTN
ncbi:MAG: DUF4214 domain-containing protein [Acidimicrobiales bacterium]|nr:DUF4214 domain-containing protein [Acidimicrobiales bacterium]